jgi:uncharacterized membrane protein
MPRLGRLALLALPLLLAVALRLLGALLRPVWVDEAATAIFSSGNSSWSTAINQLLPLEGFVRALRLTGPDQLGAALTHLHSQDNHPPLHFALAFATAQLLQHPGEVIRPLTARLPAVLLGSLAVPLIDRAVLCASGQHRAARLAGLAMALSPLMVAMGLEARHYALATTLVCAALWALAAAWQLQQQDRPLPLGLAAGWVVANALGMLCHHLFVLSIAAQVITLLLLSSWPARRMQWGWRWSWPSLLSLLLAGLWLLHNGSGAAAQQTAWLDLDPSQPLQWLAMPLQMLITALTVALAPGTTLMANWQWPFVVLAGAATLVGLISLVRVLGRADRAPALLQVFCLSSMALLLLASAVSGKDFSRALRYGFVYGPAVLALLGSAAATAESHGRRQSVRVLLVCSLVCSLGVSAGVALPASYNPALMLAKINRESRAPVVLAFNDRPVPNGQPLIGYEGLSIAWHLQTARHPNLQRQGREPLLMLLINDGDNRPLGLQQLERWPGPFDLWIINAHGIRRDLSIDRGDCRHLGYASAGGHLHHHYRCG